MTRKDRLDIINTSVFYLLATIWLLLNIMGIISVTICPLKLLFHIPCPGCGITRASGLFLQGQIIDAVMLNPNILIVLPYIAIYPLLLFIRIKYHHDYINQILSLLELKKVYIPLAIAEVLIWLHNIVLNV